MTAFLRCAAECARQGSMLVPFQCIHYQIYLCVMSFYWHIKRETNNTVIGGSYHKYNFCRDKYLSRQTWFCRDKHLLVATKSCLSWQIFVATKVLSEAGDGTHLDNSVYRKRRRKNFTSSFCRVYPTFRPSDKRFEKLASITWIDRQNNWNSSLATKSMLIFSNRRTTCTSLVFVSITFWQYNWMCLRWEEREIEQTTQP